MNIRQEKFHKTLVEKIKTLLHKSLGRVPTEHEILLAISRGCHLMGWAK